MIQESIEQNTENELQPSAHLQELGIDNGASANTTEHLKSSEKGKRPGPKK